MKISKIIASALRRLKWPTPPTSSSKPKDDVPQTPVQSQVPCNVSQITPSQILAANFSEGQTELIHAGAEMSKLQRGHVNIYNNAKQIFEENRWDYSGLIARAAKIINENGNSKELAIFCELLLEYRKNRWSDVNIQPTNTNLVDHYIKLLKLKPSFQILELFRDTLIYFKKNKWTESICTLYVGNDNIFSFFERIANLKPPPAMLNSYSKALSEGHFKDANHAIRILREIIIHTATWVIIKGRSQASSEAVELIQNAAINDHVPYSEKDPKTPEVRKQTRKVLRRAFNLYHGFSAKQIETRRPVPNVPSLLFRFGLDVASQVNEVHAGDINKFPGKGFYISGLIPEKIFVQDTKLQEKGKDPFSDYKAAWPFFAREFDDLPDTDFIFTRGFIAVSCPLNEKYMLDGTHYSYIVFNDHHHNYDCDIAFLVPTKSLYSKIRPALIPNPTKKAKAISSDINERALLPKDLITASKQIDANVLNIGWGSNIGGSLSNAYPIDSRPFHTWEPIRREAGETIDYVGHVHKSHMLGSYRSQMDSRLEEGLKPFRKAHEQVYRVTNSYQNLYDLFRLSLGLWHKGFTLGTSHLVDFNPDEMDLEEFELEEDESMLVTEGDISDNPRTLRMLEEAFLWHTRRKTVDDDREHYPILTIADTLDDWTLPTSPFMLDTYDMTAFLHGEINKLNYGYDSPDTDSKSFWYNVVMPILKDDSSKDFRFYHRKDLGLA